MIVKSFLLIVILSTFLIAKVNGCGKGHGKKNSNPPDNTNNPSRPDQKNPNAIQNQVGDKVQTSQYEDNGCTSKNGADSQASDFNCDFETTCSWKNAKPPTDTMEWLKASGEVDHNKMSKFFGDTKGVYPTGKYLIVSSNQPTDDADNAILISCPISCAASEVTVTVKYWKTDYVKLKVCEVPSDDPTKAVGCADLTVDSGITSSVTLPPGEQFNIIIEAVSFGNPVGSVGIIDDITVEYQPCVSTTVIQTPPPTQPTEPPTEPPQTQPPPPPPDDTADAQKVCCTFDSNGCNWSTGNGPSSNSGKSNNWQAVKGKYRNPATGVAPSPDNNYYGSYMKPRENSYAEVQTSFLKKKTIKFQEYKATQDVNLKACCNTEQGCSYDTGKNVQKADFRQWYQASVDCPAGTNKVIFFAENTGDNEGGVGIDNVQVFDENGQRIC